ncbi:MAG: ABC transporter ATP-binding protein, partial [Jannaschia sp.]
MTLLSVEGLSISFPDGQGGRTRVVDHVSFTLGARDRLGVIGESGSGKTMIGRAILGLLPPGGRIDEGRILWEGRDVAKMTRAELRAIRGARIGMVFQEPMVSLNPSLTIGRQMTEGVMLHRRLDRRAAEAEAAAMLERVRMEEPHAVLHRHPHEFSGGMRQRIMLASVLMLRPALLIADEPTTALDAVIQKDIMALMDDLVNETGTALMLVSHDLPLVAQHTRVAIIMQTGRVVETGAMARILSAPERPYTARLVAALPRPGTGAPLDRAPVL